jgi:tRNA modification GTPase
MRIQNSESRIQNKRKSQVISHKSQETGDLPLKRQMIETIAAVTTGKGTGAIATIELFGKGAEVVLKKIFCRSGGKNPEFGVGKILVGSIKNGKQVIDQVTIGCEGENHFAINCHGNPLIVADIMALLQKKGVKLVSDKKLLCRTFSQGCANTIEIEARLAQVDTKALLGTKIILNQINSGLSKTIRKWRDKIDATPLVKIKNEAKQILYKTEIAKPIIYGAKVVLAGPANTGKSTLLNYLAGRQKAIVTDFAGTTRDYVTAECRIGPLYVEFIDTAGLGGIRTKEFPDKAAQKKAMQIIKEAHLILLVLDNSQPENKLDKGLLKKNYDKPTIVVLNKADKPARFKIQSLPPFLSDAVRISSKTGAGIDKLLVKIRQKTGVDDFDLTSTVCITSRQERLINNLVKAKSKSETAGLITELLNGRLRV